MPRDVRSFEAREGTHPDVIELREQKCIDKVATTDCELRVINSFLCNLESRRPRAEKTVVASPVEFGFEFLRPRNDQRQMYAKQIVPFDYVRIALFNET